MGHQSEKIVVKLRSKSISPTREFKQGFKGINTLSSPSHLSGWLSRDPGERDLLRRHPCDYFV
jgi:hypothetical protein